MFQHVIEADLTPARLAARLGDGWEYLAPTPHGLLFRRPPTPRGDGWAGLRDGYWLHLSADPRSCDLVLEHEANGTVREVWRETCELPPMRDEGAFNEKARAVFGRVQAAMKGDTGSASDVERLRRRVEHALKERDRLMP